MRWYLVLALAGCNYVIAPRIQAPVYDLRAGTPIVLVAVEEPTWRDCKRGDIRGDLRQALDEEFAQRGFPVYDHVDDPEAAPSTAPLRLSVKVETWPCGDRTLTDIDVTFVMRMASGAEVETQRIQGSISRAMDVHANRVTVTPGRGLEFQNFTEVIGWAEPAENARALAAAAIAMFARAYVPSAVGFFTAELDPEGGKAGIELARTGQFVAAIREFQRVGNPAALFNLGQMLVLAGLDRNALLYFERAAASGNEMAADRIDACRGRVAYQKQLPE